MKIIEKNLRKNLRLGTGFLDLQYSHFSQDVLPYGYTKYAGSLSHQNFAWFSYRNENFVLPEIAKNWTFLDLGRRYTKIIKSSSKNLPLEMDSRASPHPTPIKNELFAYLALDRPLSVWRAMWRAFWRREWNHYKCMIIGPVNITCIRYPGYNYCNFRELWFHRTMTKQLLNDATEQAFLERDNCNKN